MIAVATTFVDPDCIEVIYSRWRGNEKDFAFVMKMSKRSKVSEFDIEQIRVNLVKDRVGQVTIIEAKDMMGKEYVQIYLSIKPGERAIWP
jgi:hypothetical protein